ncbi:1,3-propanediol dehydrogenase [Pelagimonas phthalicica]|uniref:Alcohol dehydrogenase 2 n=1 Tax=Pelagimonas phthalicica TaxID=1037362 RepID=A0A238JAP3_9RHOB|nr:iron-containing alcohol dehydrogenase [Pelagimonas phthalicica]TDS94256.1 alcohol dehydrogenase class IV [Pelagimonas phthalicica]SMX27217.1 1,3-propanediol dehydrogenase [Pelagimonas phthalicica]
MSDFIFNTTPSVRQMAGGAAQIGDLIAGLPKVAPSATVLFVTDPGIMGLGLAEKALQDLSEKGFEVTLFDQVEPDPKATTVLEAAEIARNAKVSAVIGFGGGSSMDVAKVVALCLGSDQPLDDMYGVGMARGNRLPLVLVPTTAGTGSEVTPISILTTGTAEKKGISSALILPDIALLDCDLTLGLPPAVTAATGVDAMVHAIEAYTSKSANNNPISRILAVQALKLLSQNIREAVFNGSNREARANMLLGSMLAGQAFANSPVAAVHALAYPVGSLFKVPHGLSNALVLPAVMRFNALVAAPAYAELAPHIFPDIATDRDSQAITAELIDRLAGLNTELGLEPGLRGVGIEQGDIAKLSSDAMNQTRLLVNNPRDVTEADAACIYEASL